MTDHLTLPDRLDSSRAPALMRELMARRGGQLVLDAAGVEVIGALALEVIVSAGRQWEADGHALTVARPSERYLSACSGLGLRADAPWLNRTSTGEEQQS